MDDEGPDLRELLFRRQISLQGGDADGGGGRWHSLDGVLGARLALSVGGEVERKGRKSSAP